MLGFITRRLLSGVLLLFVITTLAYFLVFFTVDGVAYRLLGDSASQADIIAKNHELGLDRPFFTRYFDWLMAALRGDFGTSWFNNERIIDALANRLPVTVTVVGIAILISAVLAVNLGMAAAIKGGWIDRLVQLLAIAGFGLATFVFGVSTNFWLSVVALFFTGAFDSISVVIRQTVLRFYTPDEMRGRVSSVNGVFVSTSNEMGAFESGVAAKIFGTVPSVLIGAGATLVLVSLVAVTSKELFDLKVDQKVLE